MNNVADEIVNDIKTKNKMSSTGKPKMNIPRILFCEKVHNFKCVAIGLVRKEYNTPKRTVK